ncbi:hypothetical protein M5K25_007796 [Dendrobium thyrsiflorum]|uniref:Uncharacterized protein n=1 Tax=Dendrobium thyrsiflorum TaxID=117978 RepID=A0ABD0VM66_DENTH
MHNFPFSSSTSHQKTNSCTLFSTVVGREPGATPTARRGVSARYHLSLWPTKWHFDLLPKADPEAKFWTEAEVARRVSALMLAGEEGGGQRRKGHRDHMGKGGQLATEAEVEADELVRRSGPPTVAPAVGRRGQ